jgi:hypothetical protein
MTEDTQIIDYQVVLDGLETRLAGRFSDKLSVARRLAKNGAPVQKIHFLMQGFFNLTEIVAFIEEAKASEGVITT